MTKQSNQNVKGKSYPILQKKKEKNAWLDAWTNQGYIGWSCPHHFTVTSDAIKSKYSDSDHQDLIHITL